MNQLKFGMQIKEARIEKGWTQKELASRLQVTDKAVSKWERSLSLPDIELLGPISKELNIPLTQLLDVEEIAPASENQEEFNFLLEKLLAVMQKNVHQELKRRKKFLCMAIAVFVGLSVLITAVTLGRRWYRNQEYQRSKHIISENELEVHFIEEKDDRIFLSLAVPDETVQYGILEHHWYDKNDPSIAYIQFVYYDKPWLLDDSTEQYWDWANQTDQSSDDAEHNIYIETGEQRYAQGDLNGFTSFIYPLAVQMSLIDRDMNLPVNKIIYQGEEDMVLWEK